jgi:hypothetical protein
VFGTVPWWWYKYAVEQQIWRPLAMVQPKLLFSFKIVKCIKRLPLPEHISNKAAIDASLTKKE